MSYAILITGDLENPFEIVDFPESENRLKFYYDSIDCSTIDIVAAYGLEGLGIKDYDLVVDDEGLLTGKEINLLASLLYGFTDHGQPLVGKVMVCRRALTPYGVDSTGLNAHEIRRVMAALYALVMEYNEKRQGGGASGEDRLAD